MLPIDPGSSIACATRGAASPPTKSDPRPGPCRALPDCGLFRLVGSTWRHIAGNPRPLAKGWKMAQVQRQGGGPGGGGLAEVIDLILDKGIVIDAWVSVSLVGIEVIGIRARVVVASV